MFGIIGAMELEINGLQQLMEDKKETKIGMDMFISGMLYGRKTVLAVCGPGKVNAAITAQNMIREFNPEWILNVGVAGAGDDGIQVGDMVIATSTVQHDMDTSPIGDPVGFVSRIGLINIPCDDALRSRLCEAARQLEGVHVYEGVIATGDQFISDGERRKKIHQLFDSKAVEMEGAAIAHVCYVNHVPCGVLRSVSDQADGSAEMDYPTFAAMAAGHAQKVIECFMKSL